MYVNLVDTEYGICMFMNIFAFAYYVFALENTRGSGVGGGHLLAVGYVNYN